MRKKRILMVGEHHIAKSGFGLYTREILSRLHKSGKYEIAELSCFNDGSNSKKVPWRVYPNAKVINQDETKLYNTDPNNVFGKWRFDQVVLDFKPDIVFDIRDPWMLEYQSISLLRPYFHWIIAPTVDSIPQQMSWLQTFSQADIVLAHTDWAVDYLKRSRNTMNAVTSVSDSVDTDVFRPINFSATLNRAQHMVPKDAFVVGAVMRNQKRKLIPNLMGIVKNARTLTKKNILLYLHTSYPERMGWDIPTLLQEYEAYNFVLFTYYCDSCSKAHASTWKGSSVTCPFCFNKTAHLPNVVKGLSDAQLRNVYNLFDFYIQYAICEGLGIPQLEAAACGVPICSVDYSAMSEVTDKLESDKITYALFKEMETGAFRALPNDGEATVKIIQHLQDTPQNKKKRKEEIRNKILKNYSWDKTAQKYMDIFDGLEPKNMWDAPLTTDPSFHIKYSSNRQFVHDIVNNVIQSPHLLKSSFIQNIVKSLDEGYVNNNGNIVKYKTESAQKTLEQILNHKVLLERIRSKEIEDKSEFIKYGQ
jgi:glycosyltransferase involved in cell wall biosynthesis